MIPWSQMFKCRFGVSEAHGKGAALQVGFHIYTSIFYFLFSIDIILSSLQLNRFLEEGSVQLLPSDQTYQVKSYYILFLQPTLAGELSKHSTLANIPNIQSTQVNFKKLVTSVGNLVRDICTWQDKGDKNVVDDVFAK